MLFNSAEFLFVFLPLAYLGAMAISRSRPRLVVAWLGLASLAFYVYWSVLDTAILLASVIFNFAIGRFLIADKRDCARHAVVLFGLAANLGALAYFKYAGFFLQNVVLLFGEHIPLPAPALPLGISFFTFTQIAFLVDCYRRQVEANGFPNYLLFVTYFPHLIAGPIIHHKETMPQFLSASGKIGRAEYVSVGLTIFIIGLFKKVILADNIAPFADAVFSQSTSTGPSLLVAWAGALSYAMQIYFDFSGYSDMAIGISFMFGVRLPLNFNSPYKARNIIEFWRRWHMTLSRFLRDYLYYPLGGNRRGRARRYLNLLITMLLGGLWHGANWTFVVWGGLHGAYLVINHGFRSALKASGQGARIDAALDTKAGRVAGTTITFMLVVVAWVYFRATDIATANDIVRGMLGLNGVQLPSRYLSHLGIVGSALSAVGIEFVPIATDVFVSGRQILLLLALIVIVFALPNVNELMRSHEPALVNPEDVDGGGRTRFPAWKPAYASLFIAAGLGAAALWAILNLHESRFIYFNF